MLGTPLREEAWALQRCLEVRPCHSLAWLSRCVILTHQLDKVFGLHISRETKGNRIMRAQNKQALNLKQSHVPTLVQPPLFHWHRRHTHSGSPYREQKSVRSSSHVLPPPASCQGWGVSPQEGISGTTNRSVRCLSCFFPSHKSLAVLLRNIHGLAGRLQ